MKVVWTERAEEEFEANLLYLEDEWGLKATQDFIEKLHGKIEEILNRPTKYPIHDASRHIRKCHIGKRITMYYQVEGETVFILSVFNTWQSPDRLGF